MGRRWGRGGGGEFVGGGNPSLRRPHTFATGEIISSQVDVNLAASPGLRLRGPPPPVLSRRRLGVGRACIRTRLVGTARARPAIVSPSSAGETSLGGMEHTKAVAG